MMIVLPSLKKYSGVWFEKAARLQNFSLHSNANISVKNRLHTVSCLKCDFSSSYLISRLLFYRIRSVHWNCKPLIGLATLGPFVKPYTSQSTYQDSRRKSEQSEYSPTSVPLSKSQCEIMESVAKPEASKCAVESLDRWQWLSDFGPGFPVRSSNLKILSSPNEFYEELLLQVASAKSRICIASLYLGTGPKERKLVETLEQNVEKNPKLKVTVLLDHSRGSRGGDESSRALLLPLLRKSNLCEVFLYHTPTLRGIWKTILPQRWNEIIGVQHMKVYLFDDTLVISGANLSNDYFTDRQDRYIVIKDCKELADFHENLVSRVCDFSFQLDRDNCDNLTSQWTIHPSEGDENEFIMAARTHINEFYEKSKIENKRRLLDFKSSSSSSRRDDTWIFPILQMGPLHIFGDQFATSKVFEDAPANSKVKLATGYFNLTADYIQKIVERSDATFDILMAHPKANGFLGAKGFAGGIPAAYTLLATQFLRKVQADDEVNRINMYEYFRPGWTFHAKGLWYYSPNKNLPLVTLVGSPNFGYRSVYRDLEEQLYIVTTNTDLQARLQEEQERIFSPLTINSFNDSVINEPERRIPLWVRCVVLFFRGAF